MKTKVLGIFILAIVYAFCTVGTSGAQTISIENARCALVADSSGLLHDLDKWPDGEKKAYLRWCSLKVPVNYSLDDEFGSCSGQIDLNVDGDCDPNTPGGAISYIITFGTDIVNGYYPFYTGTDANDRYFWISLKEIARGAKDGYFYKPPVCPSPDTLHPDWKIGIAVISTGELDAIYDIDGSTWDIDNEEEPVCADDCAPPFITKVWHYDKDCNGFVDSVKVRWSEEMDPAKACADCDHIKDLGETIDCAGWGASGFEADNRTFWFEVNSKYCNTGIEPTLYFKSEYNGQQCWVDASGTEYFGKLKQGFILFPWDDHPTYGRGQYEAMQDSSGPAICCAKTLRGWRDCCVPHVDPDWLPPDCPHGTTCLDTAYELLEVCFSEVVDSSTFDHIRDLEVHLCDPQDPRAEFNSLTLRQLDPCVLDPWGGISTDHYLFAVLRKFTNEAEGKICLKPGTIIKDLKGIESCQTCDNDSVAIEDGITPRIVYAWTKDTHRNGKGFIDSIVVKFDHKMDHSERSTDGFKIVDVPGGTMGDIDDYGDWTDQECGTDFGFKFDFTPTDECWGNTDAEPTISYDSQAGFLKEVSGCVTDPPGPLPPNLAGLVYNQCCMPRDTSYVTFVETARDSAGPSLICANIVREDKIQLIFSEEIDRRSLTGQRRDADGVNITQHGDFIWSVWWNEGKDQLDWCGVCFDGWVYQFKPEPEYDRSAFLHVRFHHPRLVWGPDAEGFIGINPGAEFGDRGEILDLKGIPNSMTAEWATCCSAPIPGECYPVCPENCTKARGDQIYGDMLMECCWHNIFPIKKDERAPTLWQARSHDTDCDGKIDHVSLEFDDYVWHRDGYAADPWMWRAYIEPGSWEIADPYHEQCGIENPEYVYTVLGARGMPDHIFDGLYEFPPSPGHPEVETLYIACDLDLDETIFIEIKERDPGPKNGGDTYVKPCVLGGVVADWAGNEMIPLTTCFEGGDCAAPVIMDAYTNSNQSVEILFSEELPRSLVDYDQYPFLFMPEWINLNFGLLIREDLEEWDIFDGFCDFGGGGCDDFLRDLQLFIGMQVDPFGDEVLTGPLHLRVGAVDENEYLIRWDYFDCGRLNLIFKNHWKHCTEGLLRWSAWLNPDFNFGDWYDRTWGDPAFCEDWAGDNFDDYDSPEQFVAFFMDLIGDMFIWGIPDAYGNEPCPAWWKCGWWLDDEGINFSPLGCIEMWEPVACGDWTPDQPDSLIITDLPNDHGGYVVAEFDYSANHPGLCQPINIVDYYQFYREIYPVLYYDDPGHPLGQEYAYPHLTRGTPYIGWGTQPEKSIVLDPSYIGFRYTGLDPSGDTEYRIRVTLYQAMPQSAQTRKVNITVGSTLVSGVIDIPSVPTYYIFDIPAAEITAEGRTYVYITNVEGANAVVSEIWLEVDEPELYQYGTVAASPVNHSPDDGWKDSDPVGKMRVILPEYGVPGTSSDFRVQAVDADWYKADGEAGEFVLNMHKVTEGVDPTKMSPPAFGRSLDNIAPADPVDISVVGNKVSWNLSLDDRLLETGQDWLGNQWEIFGVTNYVIFRNGEYTGIVDRGVTSWTDASVSEGDYRVYAFDGTNLSKGTTPVVVIPTQYALSENYPNPFNPETHISFALPQKGQVKLTIYNVLGEKVADLVSSEMQAGYHQVKWDGKDSRGVTVSSGVYFYRLKAGEFTATKKMTLVK